MPGWGYQLGPDRGLAEMREVREAAAAAGVTLLEGFYYSDTANVATPGGRATLSRGRRRCEGHSGVVRAGVGTS